MAKQAVFLGWREAEMLMDGLIALGGEWESRFALDQDVTTDEMNRKDRLMSKLRKVRNDLKPKGEA